MAKAPVVRAQDSPGDPGRRVPPRDRVVWQPPAPQAAVAASAAEPVHPAAPREGRPRVEFLKAMEREELQTALSVRRLGDRAGREISLDARQVALQDEEARALLPVEEVMPS